MTSILKKHIPNRFRRVARTVGLTLYLGDDADKWHGLSVVLTAWLDVRERALLAWAVLRSLPPAHIGAVAEAVLPERAGSSLPTLINELDEARSWAALAAPEELDAYCLAAFECMTRRRQAAFLDFVTGRAAA
ncbi:MAG: hypothetical protein AAGA28_01570 [Pseudomonadota bacterium]